MAFTGILAFLMSATTFQAGEIHKKIQCLRRFQTMSVHMCDYIHSSLVHISNVINVQICFWSSPKHSFIIIQKNTKEHMSYLFVFFLSCATFVSLFSFLFIFFLCSSLLSFCPLGLLFWINLWLFLAPKVLLALTRDFQSHPIPSYPLSHSHRCRICLRRHFVVSIVCCFFSCWITVIACLKGHNSQVSRVALCRPVYKMKRKIKRQSSENLETWMFWHPQWCWPSKQAQIFKRQYWKSFPRIQRLGLWHNL